MNSLRGLFSLIFFIILSPPFYFRHPPTSVNSQPSCKKNRWQKNLRSIPRAHSRSFSAANQPYARVIRPFAPAAADPSLCRGRSMPYAAAADASSSTSIPKRRRPRTRSSTPTTMAADPPTAGRLSFKHGWMDPGRYPSSLGGASCRSRPALRNRPSPPPPRRRRWGSRLHQTRAPPHPTDRKGVSFLHPKPS